MEAIQQMAAATAVLASLLLTLWWLRRRGAAGLTLGRRNAARLETLDRLPLGQQHALHLVRLGDSALLISSSPAGCALIHRSEWREIACAATDPEKKDR